MSNKVYKGDVGTEIMLDCGADVSAATALAIKAQKPDYTEVTWTAELVSGETTKIRYLTQSGDLDQAGRWRLQSAPTLPGWDGRGETVTLDVHNHYC